MPNQNDPFEILATFGENPETIALIAVPLLLLVVMGVIYALIVRKKRKEKHAKLTQDMLQADRESAGTVAELPTLTQPTEKAGPSWLQRLQSGLKKTRDSLQSNLAAALKGRARIDSETLEQIHEILFRADIGVHTADVLVNHLKEDLTQQENISLDQVKNSLKKRVSEILQQGEANINEPNNRPFVILVVGVNGVGKTTTIGKLASQYRNAGQSVLLCAADTFRAAAIEQLQRWGERLGVPVIKHQQGSDPAAVAFDAVKSAQSKNVDTVLIDTAGRLHNKANLMEELKKITKVVGKDLPEAPHEVWLVIDATTGQNAISQVAAFKDIAQVTGLIVTKLDGTAKGGVVVGIADQFKIPIRYIGVGESADDLRPFHAEEFAESLF